MKDLIQIVNDEPKISHRVIAENTSNKISSIQNLITQNISDFEEFGMVEVEILKVQNSSGAVNEQKTYFLNEQQATLLMTYLRNSEIVRRFKKSLVKAFYELKEQKQLPHANNAEVEALKAKITELQSAIMAQNTIIAQQSLKQLPPPPPPRPDEYLLDLIGQVARFMDESKSMEELIKSRRTSVEAFMRAFVKKSNDEAITEQSKRKSENIYYGQLKLAANN